jgi:caffeoyl-CoA O-methyltransferase
MNITDPAINSYLRKLTPASHPVLQEMEQYAAKYGFPIIGPLTGRTLQQLVILSGAKRIFEMGSGYGYSAIFMALVLRSGGVIECTEMDKENIARGRKHAQAARVGKKIIWHEGDALESMRKAKGKYDIIFCDVDKEQYPAALKIAWPKLRKGGIMIADNTLRSARVVTEKPPSPDTAGILKFNRMIYALPDALCTLQPLRDGLMLAVKK